MDRMREAGLVALIALFWAAALPLAAAIKLLDIIRQSAHIELQ